MGRQQTLGKFFEMPPGKKGPPPQQTSLADLWGGKKKGKEGKKEVKEEAKEGAKEEEKEAGTSASGSGKEKVEREEEKEENVATPTASNAPEKRKQPSSPAKSPARSAQQPQAKKRRVIESDDEEEAASQGTASRSRSASPAAAAEAPRKFGPPKGKGKKPAPKEDDMEVDEEAADTKEAATSKKEAVAAKKDAAAAKKEAAAAKSAASAKGKGKAKDKVKKAEEEEKEVDEAAASSSAADEGEEELEDDSEEEIEEEKVASKNAEAALDRRAEVDIPGGWKVGAPVPYAALAKTFALIEATTKRIEKTSLLTSLLLLVIERSKEGDTDSLLRTVYLCINRLSPDYIGIELGIGESLLIKAIGESTGRSLAIIKSDLKKEGDLGLVAMNSKNMQKTLFKPKPLTVPFVFANLKEIALSSGHSSQNKKVSIITKLLAACQGQEAKYIVRSLEGKLRIGNAERTVLVALAHAAVLAEQQRASKKWNKEKLATRLEEGAHVVKSVYSELPSYDKVIPALLEVGIAGLQDKCKLTPGVPLKPMLAKPTKAIGEVLDRFEGKRFTCEYKYDGERAQVHRLEDGTVGVFSRNSEDMSKKYPDLVEQLPHCIKESTKSFVIDAEAVAIDRSTGKLMPFQELSKRKRKDVKVEDIQVRVCLFAFDLLYLNGEPLLHRNLTERRELLREHFQPVDFEFQFAKSSDNESTEDIQAFLDESVKDGCEGLMVKMLESEASHYEPSRRSVNWLKLKKDYLAGVGDSLDLVVVGGYYGKGKRTNVYGAFLLACYDADSEEYQTICKIGTGFSEEALAAHWDALRPLELEKCRGDIKAGGAKPDVWFEPRVVWEVLTADLSLSPVYTAAMGLIDQRGISLRFPRFIRVRDDKNADDATGPDQVAEMYERQVLAQGSSKKRKGDGDGDDGFW